MNVLVTGANGFVGKNLVAALNNIKEGKDKTRPNLKIDSVFSYDAADSKEKLNEYCQNADFVFNFAGINRPQNDSEFKTGNFDFAESLLLTLKKYKNLCPVMLSSSVQASLLGRYDTEYGRTKREAEKLFFNYAAETGAKVLVYRFPNIFGKWSKPNYNSVIATFCNNIANDLPIIVNDKNISLTLLYIDDLVNEMLDALEGNEHRADVCDSGIILSPDGKYCICPVTHEVTLGEIVDLLTKFKDQRKTLIIPKIPEGSFAKKLYSTYLSYLPKEKIVIPLKSNIDNRGSFTELIKTENAGQFSVNISKPGITKGEHWHNSKWEFFIVVKGHALIKERKIGVDDLGREYPVLEFEVTGDKPKAVSMLPGYTHNIINLSDTEELVTLMWANENFDPGHPDTFSEKV